MKWYSAPVWVIISIMLCCVDALAKGPKVEPSYAWEITPLLGEHIESTIDTTLFNYGQLSVPAYRGLVVATPGNQGSAAKDMIYFRQQPMSDFFFRDAMLTWLPLQSNHKFYNTRIPMTLLSYNTAGGKETATDRLTAVFSGNVNKQLQFGAFIDYQYSKGCYANQASKNTLWGLSGSYIGERYEAQVFFNHYNGLNKENGGITDDLYITDPAELQAGDASIESTAIPTNLNHARTRLKGQEFYMNHRYKLGFWKTIPPVDSLPEDTIERKEFVPVTSIIWTFDYNDSEHIFVNETQEDADAFWGRAYINLGSSTNPTSYWSLRNTVGLSLHEGFNKYAKAGLTGFLSFQHNKFTQCVDEVPISGDGRPTTLTPYPYNTKVASGGVENFLWVGARLNKTQGALLRYDVIAEIGLLGRAAGEIKVNGNVSTKFKFLRDSLQITGYGSFSNTSAPYLMNNFVSNYFIWKNDFGNTRRLKFGGKLELPQTDSHLDIGAENVQNLIYFNDQCMPVQHSGSVQIISASLRQNFKVGVLHWDNILTFQTSSDDMVLPLPKFSAYSNLYLSFRVAKVLHVQLGVDCNYFTKYYAPGYQPATTSFYNQHKKKVGNYPLMNAYANMKLKKARFYVLMSHFNEGLFGAPNYFSMPNYPVNPSRFQMGVSIDFAN
ncbi:MAG: putative porin [Paramuribaculum sp.]|nr:putative porin [Paramuribaculum sp.]